MELEISTDFFWTDSQVFVGDIKSEAQSFKIFVANCVYLIRDSSHMINRSMSPLARNLVIIHPKF